jgi:hypothetical protein
VPDLQPGRNAVGRAPNTLAFHFDPLSYFTQAKVGTPI